MTANPILSPADPALEDARAWVRILAEYREPDLARSLFELAVSVGPLLFLWALAWWALSLSPWLALLISIVNAGFLVRVFVIQHDCGHGSYFKNRKFADWVGRALGVLTMTPYDVWRHSHSIHHSHAGNLDHRGIGDIMTLTVAEYESRSWWGRLTYRIYRNPLFLFGFVPAYLFLIMNRLPLGFMRGGWQMWVSSMGTNVALLAIFGVIYAIGGWAPILLVFLPSVILAAAAGVWLFYIQHQFEETHWDRDHQWQLHESALHGSSFYDLPDLLRWFTANIGVHHVHHLYSRIPFYRLGEVLNDHDILAKSQRLTLMESFRCVNFHLWDEQQRRLMSFAKVRALYGVA